MVKVKRSIARGGKVAWGFWEVKRGFQNVVREEVMDGMSSTTVGWQWQKWVAGFMDDREFLVS